MEQDQRPELPEELARLHLLVWLQSAVGPIFLGAGFIVAAAYSTVVSGFGLLGCGIGWLLAFAPLRARARAIPRELRVPAPDVPRWVVRTAGVGQLVCGLSMRFNEFGALIVPADLFVAAVIFIRVMTCHGLELPTHRPGWGNLLLILLIGGVVNAYVAALCSIL